MPKAKRFVGAAGSQSESDCGVSSTANFFGHRKQRSKKCRAQSIPPRQKPPIRVAYFFGGQEGKNFLPKAKRFVGAAKKPRRLFGLWSREHEGCAVTARSRRKNRERTVSLRGKSPTQQKQNICLPTNVLFLFIQAAGLVYHHDAVVDIIKGGEPPLYLITHQRASACGLMIYNASH